MATLTAAEREAFIADVHVGVLSVIDPDRDRAPLTVPIWYSWSSDGVVSVVTSAGSRKGRALAASGRFALVAQQEELPYRYVSVEGPIIAHEPAELERDLLPMSVRYLGPEAGRTQAEEWVAYDPDTTVYRMRPEHWLSYDAADDLPS
jgi:nitroimidazol reductase NimA-like FMN-containing flavoprotein (pyridoxamine 5'-phosphate oxidase superfamily)